MSEEWPEVTLGQVATINPEKTPAWPDDHIIRYVDIASVNSVDGIRLNEVSSQPFVDAPGRARRRIRSNDVLVSTVRPNLRAFAMVPDDLDGEVASTGFAVIRGSEAALPGFLWAVVQTESFAEDMVSRCTGSNYPAVRASDVASHSFRLPPLPVQRRIVDLMTHLDDHIAALRAEQQSLDGLWWALTRSMEEEVEQAPRLNLGDVAEISGGFTKNKNTEVQGKPVAVPYLRVANVHRRFLDLSDLAVIETSQAVIDRLRLIPGDVLMNEGGDKDKLARGTVWRGEVPICIHQNHVFRVRITDDRLDPEFVSAWSNSFGQRWFETFGTQTTGIASVSKSTLSKFPVPVISRTRQSEWGDLLRAVDTHIGRISSLLDVSARFRTTLLDALLAGQVVIPESFDSVLVEVA